MRSLESPTMAEERGEHFPLFRLLPSSIPSSLQRWEMENQGTSGTTLLCSPAPNLWPSSGHPSFLPSIKPVGRREPLPCPSFAVSALGTQFCGAVDPPSASGRSSPWVLSFLGGDGSRHRGQVWPFQGTWLLGLESPECQEGRADRGEAFGEHAPPPVSRAPAGR